ncbi:hypothetical protein HPB49_005258 [Dermacentor silvarum]|uniref:Uncharacterized protein n=1 Tax=Dermacentor silvarum TaxID=543639 RepID=A0ACB8CVC3_DERSI|nr:hypothetical protein HPB49_005258 [Dermacentor silvarum]
MRSGLEGGPQQSSPGAIRPATPPPLLGLTAAAAPGESGHPTQATGDKMAGQQAGMRGYDPDAMIWTTVSTPDNGEPAPPSTFKSAALAAAVARRTRDCVLTAAVTDAASPGAPTTGVCHDKPPPHASPTAGNKGKHSVAWKPLPLPKPAPEEFVVVVKPKTRVSLSEAFQEHGLGRAFIAYLGPASVQVITVLPVREQNIIIVYTSKPEIADKIIGDFDLNSADGRVPLTGHLRQDGGNVCYGVVTVRNTDTEETLRSSLQWRQGEILEIRKFGTSNKARLTFSGKEKPRYVHYEAMLIQWWDASGSIAQSSQLLRRRKLLSNEAMLCTQVTDKARTNLAISVSPWEDFLRLCVSNAVSDGTKLN